MLSTPADPIADDFSKKLAQIRPRRGTEGRTPEGRRMNDAEQHLWTVFAAALDRKSAADRDAYLDRACAGDPGLRERVEALLRAYERAGDFLGGGETTGFERS